MVYRPTSPCAYHSLLLYTVGRDVKIILGYTSPRLRSPYMSIPPRQFYITSLAEVIEVDVHLTLRNEPLIGRKTMLSARSCVVRRFFREMLLKLIIMIPPSGNFSLPPPKKNEVKTIA